MANPKVKRRKPLSEARIEFRAPNDDYKRWCGEAARQGVALSQWIREACNTAYARGSSR